jgi:hypothetical protein
VFKLWYHISNQNHNKKNDMGSNIIWAYLG